MDDSAPGQSRSPLSESALWRVACRTVLFVFGCAFLIWLVVRLQGVVVQLLLAVIIAAGMTPLVNRGARPYRLGRRGPAVTPPRAMVVLALYILLIATIVLIGSVVIPPVVEDTEDLVRSVPEYGDDFQAWFLTLPERFPFLAQIGLTDFTAGLPEQVQDLVSQLGSQVAGLLGQTLNVLRFVVGFLSGALNGIFVLVLALYITQDSERILRYIVGFMPQQRQAQLQEMLGTIGDRLGGWLRGQIALSAIIGTVTFVGLSLIGVNYAVLLALIAAVGEAIPLIGPIISAVPAVIVAFFQSPLQGFLTLGLYILIQQLENNLIVPKVMERAVALHPLAVMVALLAGGELLGVTGAILSVPVAAALSVVVQEVRRLQRKRDQQAVGLLETGVATEERGPLPDGSASGSGAGDVSGARSGPA